MKQPKVTPKTLLAFCERYHLTRDELAATLGIEPTTMYRWAHSKTQPAPYLFLALKYLAGEYQKQEKILEGKK